MRIISGKYRGRKLNPPSRIKARPTTDMAREGLFNILSGEIELAGIRVLDLFSGTGAVSIEFLSRGAESATAIDVDILTKRFLEEVMAKWEIDNLKVVKADVFKLIKKPSGQFDVVFADPPYADPRYPQLPDMILESGWLKPQGLLILEHSSEHSFQDHPKIFLHRSYGSVNFSFFRP